MQKAPRYIQRSIRRMFYHKKVLENNTKTVNEWLNHSNIDKNTPLNDLVDDNFNKRKKIIVDGQMSIFDYLVESPLHE